MEAYKPGMQIEARFIKKFNGEWHHATVLRIDENKGVLVNRILYHACNSEWIEKPENLAKLGTHTESKELTSPYFFCVICGWSNKDLCAFVHGD